MITASLPESDPVILWRVSNYQSLDGLGGLYVAGHWHTKGHPVIYCTRNPATALLETLVHIEIDLEDQPRQFQMLKIEGPDSLSIETIAPDFLPRHWAEDPTITQTIGDQWLTRKRSLLLQVPSVLVSETWNVLVNPQHSERRRLKITKILQHPFDARLF
ncbi:MAG: RES family NAD+ phosphorylase [Acidobacteriaceae bacterium]